MKYLLVLALLLIGAVQIHTVYYDAHDESNSEFIVLKNYGQSEVSLEGWSIASPISKTDATLNHSIAAQSTLLIADKGWSEKRDDPSWPEADHEETLSLPNNNAYVQLLNENEEAVDTVGWGESEIYDTKAHPGAKEAEALIRISSTNDNSEDFKAANVTFEEKPQAGASTVNITITDSEPRLISYHFQDDSPDSQQLDIRPIPGDDRMITAVIAAEDLNGVETISVWINDVALETNSTGTQANFTAMIPIRTDTKNLELVIADDSHEERINIPVHLQEVAGLSVPSDISLSAAPGQITSMEIPISNIGTQTLDIHVRATMPSWSQRAVGEVTYVLAGANHTLTDEFNMHEVALKPGEQIMMNLTLRAGYVPASEYLGEIVIAGVAT